MEEVNAKREEIEREARKREQEAFKLASVKIKVIFTSLEDALILN